MHPSEITILFVDDSRLVRAAARKILSNSHLLFEAEDGLIAWEVLNSNQSIDIIISDLSMPNMGGLELIQRIRQSDNPAIKSLPIIISSGADEDDGSEEAALAEGANNFIAKPFNAKTLINSIQSLTQTSTSRTSANFQSSAPQPTAQLTKEAFFRQGETCIAQANRNHSELSLLKIEVDKYKILFLRQGKAFVESLAQDILKQITAHQNGKYIVARTGLAEFSILMPGVNPIRARYTAQDIKSLLEKQVLANSNVVTPLTISAGVSCPVIRYDTQFKQLVADANEKLVIAYASGGNTIITASSNALDPQKPKHINQTARITPKTVGKTQQPLEQLTQINDALQRLDINPDQLLEKLLPLLQHWSQKKSGLCQLEIQTLQETLKQTANTPKDNPANELA